MVTIDELQQTNPCRVMVIPSRYIAVLVPTAIHLPINEVPYTILLEWMSHCALLSSGRHRIRIRIGIRIRGSGSGSGSGRMRTTELPFLSTNGTGQLGIRGMTGRGRRGQPGIDALQMKGM